jgi:hypothetical protein
MVRVKSYLGIKMCVLHFVQEARNFDKFLLPVLIVFKEKSNFVRASTEDFVINNLSSTLVHFPCCSAGAVLITCEGANCQM